MTFSTFSKRVLEAGIALPVVALLGAGLAAPAYAQDAGEEVCDPNTGANCPAPAADAGTILVTGSRLASQNTVSNSPTLTVSAEEVVQNADVTVETYLNTLPAVNPAGTTTSNNPPNGGQANIDLRGLGSNRNLVLINGRRPMVSASDQTVDVNTIPQGLIERIDVITGGAGAVYGADAVAGVVNFVLKRNFEGIEGRATYANTGNEDALEWQVSATAGMNFGPDDRGNIAISYEHAGRDSLIKAQRPFSQTATATTSFLPEGLYFPTNNAPSQAAVNAYFAQFGVAPGGVQNTGSLIGFNIDGSLFSRGVFNTPSNVVNYRYPLDGSVNLNLYPDVYSYNFDFVNLLVLPLNRDSVFGTAHYELTDGIEIFAQGQWANYTSASGLAPSPISTVTAESLAGTEGTRAKSALVTPGSTVANQLIIPVTNPFIPAAFRTLLASRTGNNTSLVGSGATEPFLMRQRTLDVGLRLEAFDSTVWQALIGVRAEFAPGWRGEAYYSKGKTEIVDTQTGNIDTQRLQALLEAADGGNSLCAGGFNPFGRQPISQACRTYLEVQADVITNFDQQIAQAFVSGELFTLPGGPAEVVVGAEWRDFKYDFDPGAGGGPISGFNAQDPAGGTNRFFDVFGELGLPLIRDAAWAQSLDLNLGARWSHNEVRDTVNDVDGRSAGDWAYKAELSWQPIDAVRFRAGYQRSVRAPNFGELFDASGDNPQYFDPCSITSTARTTGPNAAKISSLCLTGNSTNQDVIDNITVPAGYVQTPGTQIGLEVIGNPQLGPEKADTITAGVVFGNFGTGALRRLRGSLDYYNIKVNDVILQPDSNLIIANCYNYFGNNPTYSGDDPNCGFIARGGDILGFGPNFGNDFYTGVNAGYIKTSGLDLQLAWNADLPMIAPDAGISFNLLVNHVLDFVTQELEDQPAIDYSGTVSVFGAELGATTPKWRGTLNTTLDFNEWFSLDSRIRYIDAMENRYSRIYLGEQSFTGTPEVFYFDFAGEWRFTDALTFRAGVNNAFDKQPPTYTPNVQSGTDPSVFDVIGRRYFAQARLRF